MMYGINNINDEEDVDHRSPEAARRPLHITANPQSPSPYDHPPSYVMTTDALFAPPLHSHPSTQQPQSSWFLWSCIIVGMFCVYSLRQTVEYSQDQLLRMESSRKQLDGLMTATSTELRRLGRECQALENMVHGDFRIDKHMNVASVRALHEMKKLQKKVHEQSEQSKSLKETVQSAARREVEQKYGKGKLHVLFTLVFPRNTNEGPTQFVVELAPTHLMPHSVQTFLAMVSNGLLDGCSFILNALNVIKAAPVPYDGTSARDKARQFSELGLESVAFKEYSEQYPHKQYTIAFAADGSPSFYINSADNTEIHVGDPCFGKVVSGFDVIERLGNSKTLNGVWYETKIGIKSVRVLTVQEANRIIRAGAGLRTSRQG